MPRYVVRILPENSDKPLYAIYSTIISDWKTPFYFDKEKLYRDYPEARELPEIDYKDLFGPKARAIIKDDKIELEYSVYLVSGEEE